MPYCIVNLQDVTQIPAWDVLLDSSSFVGHYRHIVLSTRPKYPMLGLGHGAPSVLACVLKSVVLFLAYPNAQFLQEGPEQNVSFRNFI